MTITREDIELYLMGEYDGDKAALEAALAEDPTLRAIVAEEAELEMLLRDAGAAAPFCAGCGDLVAAGALRCDACGVAVRPGGYTIERVLVSNAHGRMYVARDADGTQVALKELAFVQAPTLDAIAMFEREAKFLRALEHPAIPRFVASFEEGTGVHTRYYLAQELVSGEALDRRLDDHFFTETEILDIARQVLDVLVYLQSVSPMVIHRDIKPANLIAKPDGKIAVVDFGAAHVQGTTAGSTSIGTFGYMPIEQLAGQVDATTDVYALGASLLHLLSRREPWRVLQGVSLEGINVSLPLRDFLSKLVATEPAQRFANASAAVDAIERVTRGERLEPIARQRPQRRWARPLLMAAGVLCLISGGFGLHSMLYRGDTVVLRDGTSEFGTLRFALREKGPLKLTLDGQLVGPLLDGYELPLRVGHHQIALESADGQRCDRDVLVVPAVVTTIECAIPVRGPRPKPIALTSHESIPPGKALDLDVKDTSLHDVLRSVGQACGVSVVASDSIDAKITVRLKDAPCDQALEVMLESHGLWYRYRKHGNILLVAPRVELDREDENQIARTRAGMTNDPLPEGPELDLDFKRARLHDLMRMFADLANINIVVPDSIEGKVTVKLQKARWDFALQTILEANGLWYRYRPNGKLLRIAPRVELDREDEAERARNRVNP